MPDSATSSSSVLFSRSVHDVAKREIRQFHRRLCQDLTGGRDFTCMIAGDRTLRKLNRTFLDKDYPTDVLSFPAPRSGRAKSAVDAPLGDVAISADRAREQAAHFGHSLDDEIRILMLHGVLHLLGFDHERDRGAMARAETRWRKRLGLPLSLIERTRTASAAGGATHHRSRPA